MLLIEDVSVDWVIWLTLDSFLEIVDHPECLPNSVYLAHLLVHFEDSEEVRVVSFLDLNGKAADVELVEYWADETLQLDVFLHGGVSFCWIDVCADFYDVFFYLDVFLSDEQASLMSFQGEGEEIGDDFVDVGEDAIGLWLLLGFVKQDVLFEDEHQGAESGVVDLSEIGLGDVAGVVDVENADAVDRGGRVERAVVVWLWEGVPELMVFVLSEIVV